MDQFKITGKVGQGAHGYVMKGFNKFTGEQIAMKKLIVKNLDEGIPKNIMREITALKVLNHENIVEIIEVIPYGMGLLLVMEYLPSNLQEVSKNISLEPSKIKRYLKMLLDGVKFMHENHIMHRDLKPANLLISSEGLLKIGDFGLARIYAENEPEREYSHQVATRWYRAPELLYGSRNYTNSVDMWAVGCIAGELFNRSPLFPGETDIEQLAIVLHTLGTPTEESWPGLAQLPDYNKITFARSAGQNWLTVLPDCSHETLNFVKSLVVYDHRRRLTAKQAINHLYFSEKPAPCPLVDMPKEDQLKFASPRKDLDVICDEFDQIFKDF
ncbi:PREDICTED: cyclin-dependent kinase 20-like [Nicrophorus vespilloides]|uniref:Cyclin-dependent kinase 20 n=1 Tax=Nicrophorus vespilloides TaxID=110193 RepID=A0ABM1NB37_NICVS|nr:PREDICTED: cyclin-dependent kinase 20-like [Nicrophorus vespilloides]